MLFHILYPLAEQFSALNVFRYITFRTGGAMMTALIVSFLFGPVVIEVLRARQGQGQPIRDDGPASHLLTKKGTPTMGGVLILLAVCSATLLWADLTNPYIWAVLGVTVGFGGIGFIDDFLKVSKRNTKGLSGKLKLALQLSISGVAAFWMLSHLPITLQTTLAVPFFKDMLLNFGWMFVLFAVFVMVGSSNAVNLTDGLDGLAIVPVMIASGVFGIIAYLSGNTIFSNYLQLHYVPGAGELAVLCGSLVGSGLGFLWFNAPPAKVFMGDTGSLALARGFGGRQCRHQARTGSGHRRRIVCSGNRLGDRPGRLFQADRQAGLRHGAAAPSFRKEGLGGIDHRHPLLDHRVHSGAGRARNPEAEVSL